MRNMICLLLLATLCSGRLQAQEGNQADRVELAFSTGYIMFGPFVKEVTHHVRLGNMGQDQYFQVEVDKPISERLGVTAAMVIAPTHLYNWPNRGHEVGRFSWRDDAEREFREFETTWSCGTLGLRHRPTGWAEASLAAGICSLSGISYLSFGGGPMASGTLRAGAQVFKEIGDGVVLQASCASYPSYSSRATGQPHTAYRIMAGQTDYDSGYWIAPTQCGAGLRVGIR